MNNLKHKAPKDHYLPESNFKDEWSSEEDKAQYLSRRKKDKKGKPKVDLRVAYEE